jgi:archaemetzincin
MSANRNPINGLVILPFEGMPTPIVQTLAGKLEEHGISTRIEPPVPLPDAAFAPQRGQYRAESLLALVRGRGAPHVLGLTHRDLFAQDLDFVFGIAHSPGPACVVSTARLLIGADEKLFWARLVKEVIHELGHTLGLGHCENARCVMYFSNSLADTDLKSEVCCNHCAAQLRAARRSNRRHKRPR